MPTDTSPFIDARLTAVSRDGTPWDVTVRITKPSQDERGQFICTTEIVGIWDMPPYREVGGDAMQALRFALQTVRTELESAERDDVRFFHPGDVRAGREFDWRRFWFGDRDPPAA